MLLAWKAVSCFTYAGYIIGFPGDTKETVLRDIDIIKRELPPSQDPRTTKNSSPPVSKWIPT